MALTDSLRILITANGAAAEREFQRVGRAAQTNLGKAETSAQRFKGNLVSAGMGIAAFGGVALLALNKAAQAADQEEQAIAKLNNSIDNSPALVGASTDAFLEQASALQDTTRFADDATIAAQAMLGTFRLNQDQILQLTPLVQDVAAKFDVDLNRAAVNVGKAMMGSASALQRWGIILDEDRFATDRFGAVIEGLRENAGGFAEQEGQLFSGQLEIMKNNLDDLVESVGRAATPALVEFVGKVTTIAEAVGNAGDVLDSIGDAVPGVSDLVGALGDVAGVVAPWAQIANLIDSFQKGFVNGSVFGDDFFAGAIMQTHDLFTAHTDLAIALAAGEAAMEGVALATDDASRASNRLTGEWAGLENRLGDFSATLSAQESLFSFRDALREARTEGGVTRREMVGLNQSMVSLIESYVQVAEANNTAANGSVNFAGRNRELRASLGALASFIPAALRPQFQALTRDVLAVPTNVHVTATANAGQAISEMQRLYQEAIRAANAVGQTGGSLAGGGTYSAPRSNSGNAGNTGNRTRVVSHGPLDRARARRNMRGEVQLVKAVD